MTNDIAEKDPSLCKSPEDQGWSNGEYTAADLDAMYGFTAAQEEGEGTIAVEDLTPRIDQRQVSQGVDGDPYLDELGEYRVNEAGLYRDAQEVQADANEVLADVGMASTPETSVSERQAMNKTTAESLLDGQDEDSGRLSNEDRRDARNAAVATELDKAMRSGDTEPFEHLPPSVATKVGAWLGEVGRRYGGAEFAPNDEIAEIGAYIAFAEKVSSDTDGETLTHIDPTNGEVIAESTDDVIIRVLDGDPEAAALIGLDRYAEIRGQQDELVARSGGGIFSLNIEPKSRDELVAQIRRALLASSAEKLAV